MPRIAIQLSERAVAAIRKPGRHAVGGVPGLHLRVSNQHRGWVLRVTVGGRRRDLGLGPYPMVSLADARAKARRAHEDIQNGEPPTSLARQRRQDLTRKTRTFDWCAEQFIAAKAPEWSNAKHQSQWTNTLRQYASPIIGSKAVATIELADILEILKAPQSDRGGKPLWEAKTETATRLRGRIEQVFDWAIVSGYRKQENPACWRGHLQALLPTPSKVRKVKHHRALPYAKVPAFMIDLRARKGLAAKALELTILTAARSGEVRGMIWSEIDPERKIWEIPGGRMKAGRPHRVPLSIAAQKLLEAMPRVAGTDLVFPNSKNKPLSDMSLNTVLRRMKVDAVPHGFRSSFRDWAAENRFAREVAELCLAHSTKGETEASYWRSDIIEQRQELMQAWGDYCAGVAALAPVVGRKPKATQKDPRIRS